MFAEIKLPWIFHYVLLMLKDIETLAKTPDSQYCFECWVICFAIEFVFHSVLLWNRYRQKFEERFTRERSIGQVATDAVQQLFWKVLSPCDVTSCCVVLQSLQFMGNGIELLNLLENHFVEEISGAIHWRILNVFLWGKTPAVSEKLDSRSAGHSLLYSETIIN